MTLFDLKYFYILILSDYLGQYLLDNVQKTNVIIININQTTKLMI